MAVSHTTPIELTNHSAVEVTGSMLPLVVNTSRLKNSDSMSIGLAVGTNSSWRTKKPTAVYRNRPKATQNRRRPAWRNDLRSERARERPERDQHEQQQPAVEHEVGRALGARVVAEQGDQARAPSTTTMSVQARRRPRRSPSAAASCMTAPMISANEVPVDCSTMVDRALERPAVAGEDALDESGDGEHGDDQRHEGPLGAPGEPDLWRHRRAAGEERSGEHAEDEGDQVLDVPQQARVEHHGEEVGADADTDAVAPDRLHHGAERAHEGEAAR